MKTTKLKIKLTWLIEEGDGEKCAACGDVKYGKQTTLILKVGTSKQKRIAFSLCQSCGSEITNK